MGQRALVTFGTDGFVDYLQMPDGGRFSLGPVSVLRMITGLAKGRRAKQALDEFLAAKHVLLAVDVERMWSLLPFRRARFSSANSLMRPAFRAAMRSDPLTEHVELAEKIVAKVASTGARIDRLERDGKRFDADRARQDLHRIASRVTTIARDTDMAQPWVREELNELNRRASYMTYLFGVTDRT